MKSVEFLSEAKKENAKKQIDRYLSQLSDKDLVSLLPLLKNSLTESAKDYMDQKKQGKRVDGMPSDFIAYDDSNQTAKRYRERPTGLDITDVPYKPGPMQPNVTTSNNQSKQNVKTIINNLEKPEVAALATAVASELTDRKKGKTKSSSEPYNPGRVGKILMKLISTGVLGWLGYKAGGYFDYPTLGTGLGSMVGLGLGQGWGDEEYGPAMTPKEFEKATRRWKTTMKNAYSKLPELIELNQWEQLKTKASTIKNGFDRAVNHGYIVFPSVESQQRNIKKLKSVLNVSVFDEIKVDPEDYAGGGTGALVGLALGGLGGAAVGGALGSSRRAGKMSKKELEFLNALHKTNTNRHDNKAYVIKRIKEYEPTFLKLLQLPSDQKIRERR